MACRGRAWHLNLDHPQRGNVGALSVKSQANQFYSSLQPHLVEALKEDATEHVLLESWSAVHVFLAFLVNCDELEIDPFDEWG